MKNTKKIQTKKKLIFITFFVIGIVAIGGLMAISWNPKTVPYEEQEGRHALGLLAVKNTTEENPSFTTYRFSDKREQQFPGTHWSHSFIFPDEAIVFGFHPENLEKQNFLILTDREAEIKNISELPGQILTASQNPGGAYLLISGVTNTTEEDPQKKYYTCVTEKDVPYFNNCRNVLGDILTEDMYEQQGLYRIFWNKNHEQQLIIEEGGGKQRLYTFDPWDDHATSTNKEALDILKHENNPHGSTADQYDITRLSFLTTIKDKNTNKKFRVILSPNTDIYPLPENHLLLVEEYQSYILNLNNKKKSEFITLPPEMHREISVY
ncbi:MAG: hypothetical protein ABII02_04085 [Candidatus Magasanikbacteria bacterium]